MKEKNKLKIGFVTSSISYHGGWDTLSRGIVGAVAKKHDVIVLTARGTTSEKTSYPLYSVLPKKYFSFSIFNQIRIFFLCLWYFRDCDLIHGLIEPLSPGAALASAVLRVPFFMTLAGTYCVIPKAGGISGFIKRQMMKAMYRRASFIATGSKQNIERIEEVMPLGGRWQFVPFGVDPEKFVVTKQFEPSPYPFLMSVGAVKERKGADYVVRALGLLKDEFPTLRYKIAGDTSQRPQFVEKIKQLAQENGIAERVEVLGRVKDDDLIRLYSTCSAFVLAAQTIDGMFEGFPMVFYEAHSLGAPVVSTYGFGSEYVIKNGYNGFLVPQDNYVDLAEAIKKIVGNPTLRTEMSKHAIEEAHKHSWDDIAVHYLDAYDRFVTKNNAR